MGHDATSDGDAWHPARNRYCQNAMNMPVALVVFVDKTHTDLHGALSLSSYIHTDSFQSCISDEFEFLEAIGIHS